MRDFNKWASSFKESISTYDYYINFAKVHENVDKIKTELNILNTLIASENIEREYTDLVKRYPETLKCIPLLLAVRTKEIYAADDDGEFKYNFAQFNQTPEQYCYFMRKTGLFDLMENHIIHNLVDYATGVETGLDSNGRKNRGGHLMEDLVEGFLNKAKLKKEVDYFKEMEASEIEKKWRLDLSKLSNYGKTVKRFDFVVKTKDIVYAIETNFYTGGGSKLNETARSYKNIALEARTIKAFEFVWITDGKGWLSARNNLEETFDVMRHIYNISDLENGVIGRIFI